MILQIASSPHPLDGSAVEWLWLLPLLPLIGFLINGALSLVPSYKRGPVDPGLEHELAHGHGAVGHGHATHSGGVAGVTAAHGDDHEVAQGHHADAHHDDAHVPAAHRFASITSIVGPLVLVLSFGLALAMFFAMRDVSEVRAP